MKKTIINDGFLSRLEAISFNMKTAMRGFFGGTHKTNSYGSTVEFADYRDYILGDDLRRIDWNLYSRFEKFFIKLFTDERQMHIHIFLDCSASMAFKDSAKKQFALQTVAALGYLAVQNMDKVTIKLVQGNVAIDPWGILSNKEAFLGALSQLEEIEFKGESNFNKAITTCENVGSNDGMTVLVSDFLNEDNWKSAVDYLLYKKREVMLVHMLDPEEMDPSYKGRVILLDSESDDHYDLRNLKINITRGEYDAYRRALKDYLEDIKQFTRKRGITYLFGRSDANVEKLFFEQMYESGVIK